MTIEEMWNDFQKDMTLCEFINRKSIKRAFYLGVVSGIIASGSMKLPDARILLDEYEEDLRRLNK